MDIFLLSDLGAVEKQGPRLCVKGLKSPPLGNGYLIRTVQQKGVGSCMTNQGGL